MVAFTFAPGSAPSYGLSQSVKFNVLVARFGDGYSQRVRNGLNATRQTWNLTWEDIDRGEAEWIVKFMKDRGGSEVFWWTPPPPYPTDMPTAITGIIDGITVGGSPLAVRAPTYSDVSGPMLFRCTDVARTFVSPLTDTVRLVFEQEYDLGA